MKGFFKSDIYLRVLSLFLAVLLWTYIVVVLNPETDITLRDIPIIYTNSSTLDGKNLLVINESEKTVTARISGKRSLLMEINRQNIVATVDLSNVSGDGQNFVGIQVKLPVDGLTIIEKRPYNATVTCEQKISRTFNIVPQITFANGYGAQSTVLSAQTVQITGAKSVVSSIDTVAASAEFAAKEGVFSNAAKLRVVDAEGKEIPINTLTMPFYEVTVMVDVRWL